MLLAAEPCTQPYFYTGEQKNFVSVYEKENSIERMHIQLLIICVLVGSLYAGGTCPDDTPCSSGVCCKKFQFGRKYYCCKPGKVCASVLGVRACADLVDKTADRFIEKVHEEDDIAEVQAPEYVYIYPETF
ncbi:hypothetical protein JTE90_004750 [Oedothorax gibbosus]|uniref:Granulins domain-containing protein n=1 Tax=Oedothorax gibbosus TaxID=931172 RepID=A0AAV6TU79_9ARAC|nr:hypothetical protein JTE90_004750 [Oedothorax gibbosus]